ncbi:MAG: hypothetical protein U9Q03_00190 [Patescibacteria group bacterium]|nr:hypothetical protein [Patescibacteria group bacterium]
MKGQRPDNKYIVFCALFTAVGVLALLLPVNVSIRIAFTILYFLGNGWLAGEKFLPDEAIFWRIFLGALLFSSLIILFGSATYYIFSLGPWLAALTLVVVPLSIPVVSRLFRGGPNVSLSRVETESADNTDGTHIATRVIGVLLALALAALTLYAFGLLDSAATDLSVRSPWDSVPRMFFIVLFLLAAAVSAAALGRLSGAAALIPLVGLTLLATTVAVKIYAMGFGFDPFIHQATESHIFEFGQMTPKPLYYLGQYTLVTVVARMVGGHIPTIDTYLVPVAFSLVPLVAYWSLRRSFDWPQSVCATASATLLALPLSSFIMTTPQGLANALLLLTAFVCLAFATARAVPRWVPVILALTAVSVHPLAGVPLLMFVLLTIYLDAYEGPLHRLPGLARWAGFVKLVILASIALPLLFLVNSMVSGVGVTFDSESVRTPAMIIEELKRPEIATRQFSAMLDFVYSWRAARWTAIAFAGLAGIALLFIGRRRRDPKRRAAIVFGTGAFAFLVNFILLKVWVEFPFLIEYERANFADRMAELTLFILAPVAVYAFGRLLLRIRRSGYPALNVGLIVLVAAVTVSSVYLAYPRRDKYESSRGWSTSISDIESVREIDEDADNDDYVVLANQSVSAAAVREFGFRKYYGSTDEAYPDDVFFYPIPTGGRLYDFFLEMNDGQGSRKVAEQAMDLAGVDTAYYVVNHYWWAALGITINAKSEADDWWEIDEKNWVFRYER